MVWTLEQRGTKNRYTLICSGFKREHQLAVLQDLAFFCSDIDQVMALSDAETIEEVQMIFEHGDI